MTARRIILIVVTLALLGGAALAKVLRVDQILRLQARLSGAPLALTQELDDRSGMRLVASPRLGLYSLRFDLEKGQGGRAELRLPPDAPGSERWFGFATYVPDDYTDDPGIDIVSQWHDMPDKELGEPYRIPPLSLSLQCGHWFVATRWDRREVTSVMDSLEPKAPDGGVTNLDFGAARRGGWTRWVVHVQWSFDQPGGVLEIWQDGEQRLRHRGPNTYNDRRSPYWKVGLYHPAWKTGQPERDSVVTHKTIFQAALASVPGPDGYAAVLPPAPDQGAAPAPAASSCALFQAPPPTVEP